MPFCQLAETTRESSYTVIDNLFISQFMPDAPPRYTEIYLYGLLLCSADSARNGIDSVCNALNLARDDVRAAFDYWEELGLVITAGGADDFRVIYQPIKTNLGLLKKIKPGKYRDFNKKIQNVLVDRMIQPAEYNDYYMFLETTAFEPDALVAVAEYSAGLKGTDISGKYILAVARNLAAAGERTVSAVKETLESRSRHTDDIRMVLKALGSSRKIDHSDQQLFEKWTDDYGFSLDTVVFVAKAVKFGGVAGLDSLLEEYFKRKLFSPAEIQSYSQNKTELTDLAKQINAAIGVYYQNVSAVVEEYILPWQSKGYDRETLLLIANYCFKNSVRTLEGMNFAVGRFYKLGLLSQTAIHQYIGQVLDGDGQIKQILDKTGLIRRVNKTDRANYKVWTEEWALPHELILFAAEISKGKDNPGAYLSKLLSQYKAEGIKTVAQAQKSAREKSAATLSKGYEQREYSAEEIQALFDNLSDVEV